MTAKHFRAIARTLNEAFHKSNKNTVLALAAMFADDFEKFNPNFCRERFLAAVQKS